METMENMILEYKAKKHELLETKKIEAMHLVDKVDDMMFAALAEVAPEKAEQALNYLLGAYYKHFLSDVEAMQIISNMSPKPTLEGISWSYDSWMADMQKEGYDLEHDGLYNHYAIMIEMARIVSIYSKVFADENMPLSFDIVHKLALANLNDEMYDIRKYFGLE